MLDTTTVSNAKDYNYSHDFLSKEIYIKECFFFFVKAQISPLMLQRHLANIVLSVYNFLDLSEC